MTEVSGDTLERGAWGFQQLAQAVEGKLGGAIF